MTEPIYCDQCRTPVAELRGNLLVIRVKHHGHEHVTLIDIDELYKKAQGQLKAS